MQAAVKALSAGKVDLDVKLVHFVRLLRAGEPVKMWEEGRRSSPYVKWWRRSGAMPCASTCSTARTTPRSISTSPRWSKTSHDNPVFYVQYGHARGQSVFRNARAEMPDLPADDAARTEWLKAAPLEVLSDPGELSLLRKIALYPRTVEAAATAHEPHRIAFYLYELASEFHSQWTRGKDLPHFSLHYPE